MLLVPDGDGGVKVVEPADFIRSEDVFGVATLALPNNILLSPNPVSDRFVLDSLTGFKAQEILA